MLRRLWFVLRQRLRGNRVSPAAHLKAVQAISLGRRCKIHRHADVDASLGPGVRLGDGASIGRGAMIQGSRGGVRIGSNSEVNNYAIINGTGGVAIGNDTLVGPHVCIVSYSHHYEHRDRPIRLQGYRNAPITIGDDVWIGAHVVIVAGVTVGRGAVIGAGSVVTRDVEPWAVMAGAPARRIRWRGNSEPSPSSTLESARQVSATTTIRGPV